MALIAYIGMATSTTPPVSNDPNCLKFDCDGNCICCNKTYYLDDETQLCTQVSVMCATWCEKTGKCLTCFPGYG